MLALSNEEQLRHLRVDPAVVGATVVGDPCIDRLRASLALRDRYRQELGVSPDRRLVVTSSTWGPRSSLALHPELPARLLAELPADEYAVATILHPNIWVGHGPWQVRLWMRRALEAGLRLMPAMAGWQAALVAGDLLIGDHGSVGLYAIGLGLPLLLSTFAGEEMVGDGPFAALATRAPHIEHRGGLLEQVRGNDGARDPDRYADISAQVFAEPGGALENLRSLIYEAIALAPPPEPPRLLPVPPPGIELRLVSAFEVWGGVDELASGPRIALERSPAGLGVDLGERHLSVEVGETDRRLHDSASVVFRRRCESSPRRERRSRGLAWLSAALDAHPGARVVACAVDRVLCLAQIRGGPPLEARMSDPADPGLLASALYLGWAEGPLEAGHAGSLEIEVGSRRLAVALRPIGDLTPVVPPAVP